MSDFSQDLEKEEWIRCFDFFFSWLFWMPPEHWKSNSWVSQPH